MDVSLSGEVRWQGGGSHSDLLSLFGRVEGDFGKVHELFPYVLNGSSTVSLK